MPQAAAPPAPRVNAMLIALLVLGLLTCYAWVASLMKIGAMADARMEALARRLES